jgi:hypothetical protein
VARVRAIAARFEFELIGGWRTRDLVIPHGAALYGRVLRSEYGATALTGFVQRQASY